MPTNTHGYQVRRVHGVTGCAAARLRQPGRPSVEYLIAVRYGEQTRLGCGHKPPLSDEQRADILAQHAAGVTFDQLALKYERDPRTIAAVCRKASRIAGEAA